MTPESAFWLLSSILWTCIMSFYSMEEMALISFNRLRLENSVRSGSKRALWIKRLLDNPTTLFSTTLLGVNIALVISSECLRRYFITLGLNPNYSVFVSAPYMIIFGELVPMFAARVFPEHMARLGIPLLYASSTVLAPLAKQFNLLFVAIQRLFFTKSTSSNHLHLQRDELQNLIQEGAVEYFDTQTGQLESIVSKMFHLKDKEISTIMVGIDHYLSLQSTYLCGAATDRFVEQNRDIAMVTNRQKKVIGRITAWDLLFASPTTSIGSIISPLTYVSEKTSIIDTLFRMKKERTEGSFVIGEGGIVVGYVSFDDILMQATCSKDTSHLLHLEITLSASTKIVDFEKAYNLRLPKTSLKTFRELIDDILGHKPSVEDSIRFGNVEITVKKVSIRGAKAIVIRTVD